MMRLKKREEEVFAGEDILIGTVLLCLIALTVGLLAVLFYFPIYALLIFGVPTVFVVMVKTLGRIALKYGMRW